MFGKNSQVVQDFGVKSQDKAGPVVLSIKQNYKSYLCALTPAEPLASHNGGSAAF
jgi:hypothetical protein